MASSFTSGDTNAPSTPRVYYVVVAMHHNWIRGDHNKWERAKAYDAIVTDAGESRGEFIRRARASMVRMPAWEYRNPRHPGNKAAR